MQEKTKKVYITPQLATFGKLKDLTRGNAIFCADGQSGSNGNQSCKDNGAS